MTQEQQSPPTPWKVSVIIPTLNEAGYLPLLLDSLAAQTRPPDEIIVADAGSRDGTPALARQRGARVVRGGMPAVGRNAGARVAQGDLLVFLDADVVLPPDFLERAVAEMQARGYGVATALMTPSDGNWLEYVLHEAANLYFIIMQPFIPYAPGFCILARREVHQAIGGFDEGLRMSEDLDYVRRAARVARFGVLVSTYVAVSMRRLRKEGLLQLGAKYLWCEAHMLLGRPVRDIPFTYRFGEFKPPAQRPTAARAPLPVSLARHAEAWQRHLRRYGILPPRRLSLTPRWPPEVIRRAQHLPQRLKPPRPETLPLLWGRRPRPELSKRLSQRLKALPRLPGPRPPGDTQPRRRG